MKKLYEEPIFEINKFSFEEILNDGYAENSDAEEIVPTGGNDFGGDPLA